MTAALVESLIDGICRYHLDIDGLESVIAYNLDEPFIAHNDAGQMDTELTEQRYGNASYIAHDVGTLQHSHCTGYRPTSSAGD